MGYLIDLRQTVGHQPLISVGAAVTLFDRFGHLLLVHRTDTGTWGLPAGSKELNEALLTTATRELKEETGVLNDNLSLTTILSGAHMQFTYPNGDQIDAVIAVYKGEYDDKQQLTPQPGETTETAFFALSELPELTPLTQQILTTIHTL